MGAPARTPVITVAAIILVLALLSLIPPSTATYDPWAWIVWGREVVHGDLNTIDGPSWKPLPVVVTAIAALFGGIGPEVWVLVARIGTMAAVGVAFALGRRIAGVAAGLLAAAPLALAPWFFWHGWLANSEGLLVAFVFGAIFFELDRRRGLAMACGVAAALLRPEAWPFLLLYAAWVARHADLHGRLGVLAGLAILPPAWLLPEKWGSGDFWRASTRAQNPDPGAASLTAQPWRTVLSNFVHMLPLMLWFVLGAAAVVAAYLALRPSRARGARSSPAADDGAASAPASPRTPLADPWPVVLGLVVLGLAWLALVVVMTERGYSGNERYLIQPAALLVVAAGATAALVLRGLPRQGGRAVVGLVLTGVGVVAVTQIPEEVRRVVHEGRLVHELPVAIEAAGGVDRLKACGAVSTLNLMVPQVAWALDAHAGDVKDAKYVRTPVVMRVQLQADDIMRPSVGRVPSEPVLARTRYWQIEASACPREAEATR